MSFLGGLGGALQKVPGMKTFAKPINSMMQKTPGMKGAPQALGMMPKQKPIGPSPNSMPMQQMGQVGSQMMPQQGQGPAMGYGQMMNQVKNAGYDMQNQPPQNYATDRGGWGGAAVSARNMVQPTGNAMSPAMQQMDFQPMQPGQKYGPLQKTMMNRGQQTRQY